MYIYYIYPSNHHNAKRTAGEAKGAGERARGELQVPRGGPGREARRGERQGGHGAVHLSLCVLLVFFLGGRVGG